MIHSLSVLYVLYVVLRIPFFQSHLPIPVGSCFLSFYSGKYSGRVREMQNPCMQLVTFGQRSAGALTRVSYAMTNKVRLTPYRCDVISGRDGLLRLVDPTDRKFLTNLDESGSESFHLSQQRSFRLSSLHPPLTYPQRQIMVYQSRPSLRYPSMILK